MTQKRGDHSDRGPGRSLLRRAGAAQSGSGADALFARLDALDGGADARQNAAAALLVRWAERVRTGTWSAELATLLAQLEALEQSVH